jgi:hypothetical protein
MEHTIIGKMEVQMPEPEIDATEDAGKAPRFRSPPYPSIPLEKAIERAASLWPKSLHHAVSITVIASAWEYAPKSSGLFATVAALKQFGLMTDEGSGDKRRFKLTDAAIRVVRDQDPLSEKRRAAIAAAALNPKIHAELWGKYEMAGASGAMDMALQSYLTLDRADGGAAPYSDVAAAELIEEYKQTVAFAGLAQAGPSAGNEVSLSGEEEAGVSNPPANLKDAHAMHANTVRTPSASPLIVGDVELNDIRVEMSGGLVRLTVLLDKNGLDKLEKKIAALRDLLS